MTSTRIEELRQVLACPNLSRSAKIAAHMELHSLLIAQRKSLECTRINEAKHAEIAG